MQVQTALLPHLDQRLLPLLKLCQQGGQSRTLLLQCSCLARNTATCSLQARQGVKAGEV